jgi:uncharacterized protein
MRFDPFQNRLCRKIRNELSKSLMEAIHSRDLTPSNAVAQKYAPESAEECIKEYIYNRIECYSLIISQIQSANIAADETYIIVLLLWDKELFFEIHEWLEPKWLKAEGTEKNILQAFIQAAGTYILLESGRNKGARKMATKAVAAMLKDTKLLPDFLDSKLLIKKLKAVDPVPPKLGAKEMISKKKESH